ncbi:glycosyltransferase family 4 protein [Altibacter sp. HG106]|uniref:glycosyltransferase family 4 protein n=1 Tax=Altibacter sp. HG106 TaxID=3023937 RepID=UPI0023509AA1|nr:glycosyltransferase family 4 protein [Altibacter sp. HG106]MDC7995009.1 glycosyltransferase family 4 protein [Altibacter sp. HG106]
MHIAQIHNTYLDRGGEDIVVANEKKLLEGGGHQVSQYFVHNKEINTTGKKLKTALSLPYSFEQKRKVKTFLRHHKPDIAHVHNFLPVLTAAVFDACKELNIPVVLTLHNYRLLCINGLLYRDQQLCEKCLSKKFPTPGIQHACYQESRLASFFQATANAVHNYRKTWQHKIDAIIFLTQFQQSVFERSHLSFPKEKCYIKPNFAEDHGFSLDAGDYYLFVGRIATEKGIECIIEAFKKNGKHLVVVGTGPLLETLKAETQQHTNIVFKGEQNREQTQAWFKGAKATVFASRMYEGLSLVILESYSFGTPILAPDFGNGKYLIEHGKTGRHYKKGSAESLVKQIELFEQSDQGLLRRQARNKYEQEFTPTKNLEVLEGVYQMTTQNTTQHTS